jgi:hypothetical protein
MIRLTKSTASTIRSVRSVILGLLRAEAPAYRKLDELTAALAAITQERADGLFVFGNFINGKHGGVILEFAARNRLPTMYDDSDAVEDGA